MTLKTTYGVLQASLNPLQQLGQERALSPEMKLRLAKVMKVYDTALQLLQKEQQRLRDEAAKQFPKPTLAVPIGQEQTDEQRQALRDKWLMKQADSLFETPVEIDCKPLFASRFGDALPQAGHLLVLDWLIVDDVTEGAENEKT